MPAKIKRTLRKEVLRNGAKLPTSLSLLRSISFHSLVEDRTGIRTQFRVELSSRVLKALLDEITSWKIKAEPNERALADAHAEADRRQRELTQARIELQEKENHIRRLNHLIEKMNEQIGDKNVTKSSGDFKLHLSSAEKNAQKLRGLPLQGGLPGLGKRRR